jgi:hypothetical protein
MAKHRMNKSPSKRAKTTGKLVGRRRRRVSTAESVDGDSNRSVTSLDMYDEGPGDDFDFDGMFVFVVCFNLGIHFHVLAGVLGNAFYQFMLRIAQIRFSITSIFLSFFS